VHLLYMYCMREGKCGQESYATQHRDFRSIRCSYSKCVLAKAESCSTSGLRGKVQIRSTGEVLHVSLLQHVIIRDGWM
jgi:hypothetical protein